MIAPLEGPVHIDVEEVMLTAGRGSSIPHTSSLGGRRNQACCFRKHDVATYTPPWGGR